MFSLLGLVLIDLNNEIVVNLMKDELLFSDQEVMDVGLLLIEGMVLEIEILEGICKNVDNMFFIEDLSYIYENFLVFVFVVVESNFEEFYYVYENVM